MKDSDIYTGIDAQHDQDFYDECLTLEEVQERENQLKIYKNELQQIS